GILGPEGSKPLWVTELNWQSKPPSPDGVPAQSQAHWIARAMHRLWAAGVKVVTWHFLVDRPVVLPNPVGGGTEVRRPAGLYHKGPDGPATNRPKPFLRGFRFPFDPLRTAAARVRVWAMLPPDGYNRARLEQIGRAS